MSSVMEQKTKEEKDAELDRRIEALRKKNQALVRRYQEIEEDKKKAEQEGIAVTTPRKPRPHDPELEKRRLEKENFTVTVDLSSPQEKRMVNDNKPVVTDGPKNQSPSKRMSGRVGRGPRGGGQQERSPREEEHGDPTGRRGVWGEGEPGEMPSRRGGRGEGEPGEMSSRRGGRGEGEPGEMPSRRGGRGEGEPGETPGRRGGRAERELGETPGRRGGRGDGEPGETPGRRGGRGGEAGDFQGRKVGLVDGEPGDTPGRRGGRGGRRGRGGGPPGAGDRRSKEWEEKRRQNIEKMNQEMEKIAEYERGQRQDGDKPSRHFLDDPRRSGPAPDTDRKEGSRRHVRNWGGLDFDNVKTGPELEKEWTSRRPGPKGSVDMTMSMTGRERAEYLRWKKEREQIDEERLARHRNATGQWRREWDAQKSDSIACDPHRFTEDPAVGVDGAVTEQSGRRDDNKRPPKAPTFGDFLSQGRSHGPRGDRSRGKNRGTRPSYSMHDNRWEADKEEKREKEDKPKQQEKAESEEVQVKTPEEPKLPKSPPIAKSPPKDEPAEDDEDEWEDASDGDGDGDGEEEEGPDEQEPHAQSPKQQRTPRHKAHSLEPVTPQESPEGAKPLSPFCLDHQPVSDWGEEMELLSPRSSMGGESPLKPPSVETSPEQKKGPEEPETRTEGHDEGRTEGQTDTQTERQTERQIERQIEDGTEEQTEGQTDVQTEGQRPSNGQPEPDPAEETEAAEEDTQTSAAEEPAQATSSTPEGEEQNKDAAEAPSD